MSTENSAALPPVTTQYAGRCSFGDSLSLTQKVTAIVLLILGVLPGVGYLAWRYSVYREGQGQEEVQHSDGQLVVDSREQGLRSQQSPPTPPTTEQSLHVKKCLSEVKKIRERRERLHYFDIKLQSEAGILVTLFNKERRIHNANEFDQWLCEGELSKQDREDLLCMIEREKLFCPGLPTEIQIGEDSESGQSCLRVTNDTPEISKHTLDALNPSQDREVAEAVEYIRQNFRCGYFERAVCLSVFDENVEYHPQNAEEFCRHLISALRGERNVRVITKHILLQIEKNKMLDRPVTKIRIEKNDKKEITIQIDAISPARIQES